ncbi:MULTISPECIES: NUDIX domain-containing protein [Clostridium]|mgnify:FL=1|uniref:NUDIX domain-containing protein n=1 Tax=Clostridium TaxID=1485 RepID=UPI001CAF269C|nr:MULTISPECIES: NUDIX domain-containing protein [Clostridium]MDJ8942839.1 NUDIX domain-containing protein [Clostridium perfringens]MDK0581678.1 NUDIX domain-containing protein [Clostridium perfringens]MDK0797876.1 NUDIX domain-containing protein [Clostridium perfringens]MDM0687664.1 NUDIX domain-containing protein [Clostridium perfringens]MDM0694374.1 NUDIX domain-containing protein [Clostridium perfringens]
MLPLGEHIEVNELPKEAYIREAKEEAGLNVTLYNPIDINLKKSCDLSGEKLLINPIHTILGDVSPNHSHIDFVYYATTTSFETSPEIGESKILKWYSKKDLKT